MLRGRWNRLTREPEMEDRTTEEERGGGPCLEVGVRLRDEVPQ